MFTAASRYHGIDVARYEPPGGGDPIPYVRRRLLPDPGSLTPLGLHTVTEADRLDRIAAAAFGDPELFWRIADANPALDPEELTARPGRRLLIALSAAAAGSVRGF
ncbi:LysM domain-containing protein [Streptomyces sp. NPDC086549]|uniref:LysM domain-containing protein n=1 Tax=Streptomyces sp. NPDC086549 TaxID=3365752 RepID=UPI003803D054